MRALDIMMRHNTIRRNNFLTLAGGAQQAMRLAKLINHAVYKDPARIEDLLYPLRGYETLRGDRQWQDKRRLLGLG